MIEIKSKDGSIVRCVMNEFDYNGVFMGECFITFDIKSPSPIDFSIGDYLDYRGERFTLNYTPAKKKQARNGSYGEAFVYGSLKFNSSADELTRCRFLDYVSADNKVHFSSLPIFSFYAISVCDLAERIQVNLDRMYQGAQKWTVTVEPSFVSKDKNISVNNISCFDAVSLANSEFSANFIIRGRTIKIGTSGLSVGAVFGYGKGNGLYDIEQTTNSDNLIITRLMAYGSQRNLPNKYYNKLKKADGTPLIPESQYITNLMLPSFSIDGKSNYIDSPNIEKYGVREGCVYFDGSDTNIQEIYPSIDGMTANDLILAGIQVSIDAGDNGRLDEIASAEQIVDDGNIDNKDKYTDTYTKKEDLYNSCVIEDKVLHYVSAVDCFKCTGIKKGRYLMSGNGASYTLYVQPEYQYDFYCGMRVVVIVNDILVSEIFADNVILSETNIANERTAKLLIPDIGFDVGKDNSTVYIRLYSIVDQTTTANVTYHYDITEEYNGEIKYNRIKEKKKSEFKITLKDIGFDINNYLTAETATISMKSGMCIGREFEIIKNPSPIKVGNKYVLTCNKVADESTGYTYPNSNYQISAGDKFVLLHIEMPDVYVKAAEQRLLPAAREWLSNNDESKYIYSPKIDELFMARHPELHNTIKEGDIFNFKDTDLSIDASVIVQSLVIHEEGDNVPTYEVTLNNDRITSSIEKIQNSVSGLMANVTGVTIDQVKSLINIIGNNAFLSKITNDTAAGFINFLKGFSSKELATFFKGVNIKDVAIFEKGLKDTANPASNTGWWIGYDAQGNAVMHIDKIEVRMEALFKVLKIDQLSFVDGGLASTCGSMICSEVQLVNGNYRCFFNTSDGKVVRKIELDDQVRCQVFTGTGLKYYWRLVVGVGNDYIDLSDTDKDGSGVPAENDHIIQLGNRTNPDRQNAIILETYGTNAPSFNQYEGINSFTLVGKAKTTFSPKGNLITGDLRLNNGKTVVEYTDGKITETITSTDEKIATVKADGRNLLRRSRCTSESPVNVDDYRPYVPTKFVEAANCIESFKQIGGAGLYYYCIKPSSTTGMYLQFGSYSLPADVLTPPYTTVTVAFDYYIESATDIGSICTKFRHTVNGSYVITVIPFNVAPNTWHHVEAVVDMKDYDGGAILYRPIDCLNFAHINWSIYYKNMTLKVGSPKTGQETPWSPAPEDTLDEMQKRQEENLINAKKYADDQASAVKIIADKAVVDAKTANDALGVISSDDIISSFEKSQLKKEWDIIVDEKPLNVNQAVVFAVQTTEYVAAYSALESYIGTNLTNLTTDWALGTGGGATLRTKFKTYYTNRTTLLNSIATIAKQKADAAQISADAAKNKADENKNFITTLGNGIKELQNQIDGVVDSWYYGYTPSATNYPSNMWTDDVLKEKHVGDTFVNTQAFVDNATTPDAGKAWRWVKNADSTYLWTSIADSDTVKALLAASKAQDAADGKRRVFVAQPIDAQGYDIGDLWVNANFGIYVNELLVCVTSKKEGIAFNISHWSKATKYTDDTATNALNTKYTAFATKTEKEVSTLMTKTDGLNKSVSEIKQTADNISLKVSEIKVGGKNYFKKTTEIMASGSVLPQATREINGCVNGLYIVGCQLKDTMLRFANVIDSNGFWTVSFDLRGSQNNSAVGFYIDICDNICGRVAVTADNEWRHHVVTANVTNYSSVTYNFVDFEAFDWAYIYVRNIKIEKGNMATDWSPAPEDIASKKELEDTGIDIYNNRITLTADKTLIQANDGTPIAVFEMVNGKPQLTSSMINTDTLTAKKVQTTNPTTNSKVIIEGGVMSMFGTKGVANWRMGTEPGTGEAVLDYYDNSGAKIYSLGPKGINMIERIEAGYEGIYYIKYNPPSHGRLLTRILIDAKKFLWLYHAKRTAGILENPNFAKYDGKYFSFNSNLSTNPNDIDPIFDPKTVASPDDPHCSLINGQYLDYKCFSNDLADDPQYWDVYNFIDGVRGEPIANVNSWNNQIY